MTNNLYIWDYVTNFRYYLAPFPNFYVLAENMKTFLSHNVIGIYEEGQYESSGGSFAELRAWVISQLLWNPEQDTKALVKEFIDYCYGAAAPYVQEYFDLCHSQVKDGVVWGLYYHEWHPMFTEEFMTKATELARKAREAVKDEGEDLKYRVDLVDLQLKFLHLVRKPKEAMEDGTYEYFNDFIRRHNIIVSEWRYGPKGWIEYYNKTYINK